MVPALRGIPVLVRIRSPLLLPPAPVRVLLLLAPRSSADPNEERSAVDTDDGMAVTLATALRTTRRAISTMETTRELVSRLTSQYLMSPFGPKSAAGRGGK